MRSKLRRFVRPQSFLIGVMLLTPGCAAVSQVNLVSEQEEIALGERFSKQIESELPMYNDPVINAYVDSLGQLLAAHSDRPNIEYHIKVVDTDDVNAFAVPGGWLYVNRGLISTAESESELAAVMGHEIGHIVGRHSARQMTQQYGISILASLALGEDPGLLAQMVANVAANGALMRYSRDMESESDRFGIDECYRAGIDPGGMATFFEKLWALQGGGHASSVEKFFSSHPPTEERIANSNAMIASLPPKPGLTKDSNRFHQIQKRLPSLGEAH